MFASYSSWLTRELEKADPDLAGPDKPVNMSARHWQVFQDQKKNQRHGESTSSNSGEKEQSEAARLEKVSRDLARYEHNFSRHLQILLDALNHYAATETVVLLGLCARLSTANQGTEFSGLRNEGDGASGTA